VLPFLIGYLAACFAIIEFLDITSSRFTLPDIIFTLLYIFSAIGIPLVIILPWFIYRKRAEAEADPLTIRELPDNSAPKKLHNLPAQLTTFIGRKEETNQIRDLISEHRITTITGSGGCGKTRLACEVADRLVHEFKDGAWFVDLAPVQMDDLVAIEICEALNIPELPGLAITDNLIHNIKEKKLLIILDNCEHLIKSSAEITANLIKSVPGLKIMATSREPLGINGEQVWRIPSLSLPDQKSTINVENAEKSEAILFFKDRARLNNPGFELVAENIEDVVSICNRLDGIPLAIELVASRIKHMNPQMMRERLSGKFELLSSTDIQTSERQKTLFATIEWSYNLLSDIEKSLFTRLSVFNGNFDLTAVEQVCTDQQLKEERILDLISGLIDKSMIHVTSSTDQSMSYNFYETLREFALQHLQSKNEEEKMRMLHLQYYLRLSGEANEERNTSQSKWLKKLEVEHDNLIAALEWSDRNSPEEFMHLSGNLAWFWVWRSHYQTGSTYLEKSQSKGYHQTASYARVIAGTGTLSFFTGYGERAITLLKQSTELWKELKNPREHAITMNELSLCYSSLGDSKSGLEVGRESLKLAELAGNPATVNHCRISVCQALVSLKQLDEVRPLAEQILIDSKLLDQPLVTRMGYHFLADYDLMKGNFQEAEFKYGEALKAAHESGNMLFVGIELLGVAMSVSGQQRYAKAMRLCAAITDLTLTAGYIDPAQLSLEFWAELVQIHIVQIREKLGKEELIDYEEEGKSMSLETALEYAWDKSKD